MHFARFLLFALLIMSDAIFAKAPETAFVVETVVVKPVAQFSVERRYIGTIRAERFSLLTPKSAGIVQGIHVNAGQQVKKGQLLVSLKGSIERRSMELAEQNLKSLNSELTRNRSLLKSQDVTKSHVEKLEREVLQARSKLEEQNRLLENVEIRAPFDGIVGVARVVLGESVQATTTIISVMDGPFSIFINIPASRLGEIKPGQPVRIKSSKSIISAVEMSIDPVTRTGFAKAIFPTCEGCIVGDSAYANITVHEKSQAILINRNAIYYQNAKPHVVVVTKGTDGKELRAKVREVVVGEEQDGLAEITEGLASGEEIITANPKRVTDGALLSVVK